MASNNQYVNVAGVLDVLDTGDRPIKVIGEDEKIYLIKHNISGHLQSNLIREWICYQLYTHLGIAIPKAGLLFFNPMFFSDELKALTGRFNEQVVFGSEWIEARDIKDELYEPSSIKSDRLINPEELARFLVMDLWLKNNDRTHNNLNLIVSQRKVYAIDHAATFDQQRFDKLADPVIKDYFVEPGEIGELLVNTHYFDYYFVEYHDEFEKVGLELCDKILQIENTLINKKILHSLPSSWNLTSSEQGAITEYLIYRKKNLKERFLGHLDFSRQ